MIIYNRNSSLMKVVNLWYIIGLKFLKENISKLEDENEVHMPIGFEVALPSLIDIARKLDIEVPEDTPALKEIYARRNLKLTK